MLTGRVTWPAARAMFVAALLLFVITIVIGILNGIDVWEPDHDTLITHVHAGTLGWITLMVSAVALLVFGAGADPVRSRTLGRLMIGAITLYVAAFWIGDRIWDNRIQRPFAGTLLLLVVIAFLVWLLGQRRRAGEMTVARLGLLLAWVSLLVGAVFGIMLGLYIARGSIPGLPDDVAEGFAMAHPPAMVIGFVILAGLAIAEWALRPESPLRGDRLGATQMWLIFAAGMLVNVAFVIGVEDLLGPANLIQIAGVVIFLRRLWPQLRPAGWRGAGAGVFPRVGVAFLVANMVLLTVLVAQILSGAFDIDDPTDANLGLVIGFDHVWFVGVMTNILFGVVLMATVGTRIGLLERLVLWGVNVGLVGFVVGLITVTQEPKRIFTPLMGVALLVGIAVHVRRLMGETQPTTVERGF
jgi:hypothetical protein